MPTNIDETELARLEALAGKASTLPFEDMAADGWGYVVVDILHAVTSAVPALVAEIRRLREKVEEWEDAAEFEAAVVSKLTRLDAEDIPCANSMVMFCPRPPFSGRNCGPWCLLRMARLEAEEEMGKHADRE